MSPSPLYEVIERDLAEQISSGALPPGVRLSSEFELAQHYGVSRMTLRQALGRLESDGLIVRRHGSGTFVSEERRIERRGNRLGSFHDEVGLPAEDLTTRMLEKEVVEATPELASALGLSNNHRVIHLRRLRLYEGHPISYQQSWIPYLLAPALVREPLLGGSLYRTLASVAGIEIARADQRVTAALLDDEQAALLEKTPGDPVIRLSRVAFTAADVPFEVAESLTSADLPLVFTLEV